MKKINLRAAAAAALALAMAASLAGCSSSDTASSGSTESSASSDTEVKLYSDDSGVYYTQDDTKYYVSATQEEITYDPVYETYDEDGLKFDIPDGWYVDMNYSMPVVFPEEDGESSSEYLYITTPYNLVGAEYDEIDEAFMEDFFQTYVDNGYFSEINVEEKAMGEVSGYEAKAYVVTAYVATSDSTESESTDSESSDTDSTADSEASESESAESESTESESAEDTSSEEEYDGSNDYRMEYIFINSPTAQAVYVNSVNIDENFETIADVCDSILDSLEITEEEDSTEETDSDTESTAEDEE